MRVFQEARPERARTYRSMAEAFRTVEYASAIERPAPSLIRRLLRWLWRK